MTSSTALASTASRSSSALPLPMYIFGSGLARRPVSVKAMSAPALRASRLSSSRLASKSSLPKSILTSAACVVKGWCLLSKSRRLAATGIASRLDARQRELHASGGFRVRMEVHRACRHHRRDRVLVNHLSHGIAEQNDILVERFDVALQLDAIHKVDRHGHMFFAQCVQERVL